MSRFLYIGQYSSGTTSKMRAETLKEITAAETFEVIDTHVPFYACHPLWRSIAFRYKTGKVIWDTNRYILDKLSGEYDAIWVDKAVFISKNVTQKLRASTKCLVHYTPDAAFKENASDHFYKSLTLYHYCITTKSFEIKDYLDYIDNKQLIYIPQGYNPSLHYPRHSFQQKEQHVLFIGLYEASRAAVIGALLQHNIPVVLAGKNWESFVSKHHNSPLTFLGDGLFGEAYAKVVSKAQMALGLVSKRFPELHTTRTFEITACGTALLTEYNRETAEFYKDNEAIFFRDTGELIDNIRFYFKHPEKLQVLTNKGLLKVRSGGYDYKTQLTEICERTGILKLIK